MSRKIVILLFIFIGIFSCSSKLKYEKKDLILSPTSVTNLFNNFAPKNINENIPVTYSYYKLSFSEKYKQAQWVFYMLTKNMLEKNASRSDDFRVDPNVKNCAKLSDFRNSGYDRGHLLPAGDMVFSALAMSETFFLTNISPQNPSFNRGKWSALESKLREWAEKYDTIFIATAGILNSENLDFIGDKVTIPKFFYKIVLVYKNTEKKAIAFKMENTKLDKELSFYTTNIREIENLTGIDFFYLLDKKEQDIFENQNNYIDW